MWQVDRGKDLVLLLTASGNLVVLQYNSYLGRCGKHLLLSDQSSDVIMSECHKELPSTDLAIFSTAKSLTPGPNQRFMSWQVGTH